MLYEVITAPETYRNPTPVTRDVACAPNADVAVAFDMTVVREAQQGFFDVAVTFQDIFCSAKLDCEKDGADGPEPLTLLFNPLTGAREATAVLAFSCTAGPDAPATYLHLDDLRIGCTDGTTVLVHPSYNFV